MTFLKAKWQEYSTNTIKSAGPRRKVEYLQLFFIILIRPGTLENLPISCDMQLMRR